MREFQVQIQQFTVAAGMCNHDAQRQRIASGEKGVRKDREGKAKEGDKSVLSLQGGTLRCHLVGSLAQKTKRGTLNNGGQQSTTPNPGLIKLKYKVKATEDRRRI
jgi:hypothetical protein